ncbi:translation elongation factor 4 [Helicobacter sp. L8]|uniref:translation elongation factor 4 n=1 Tax=Helicobacter sp. L8 TaxID=2316078 RepID=UPI000EB0429F|nr:translation elongation factor 4 [Helicobacter sp. L8]
MQEHIRNFSIIAHIDHGKSTLADCLISACNALDAREMTHQVLDTMEIEKERGITIKAQSVRLRYFFQGVNYILNLIDTPGHVDFSYEVSRSLHACEGALLVVDATQGVQAQTIANVYIALDNHLEILPVLNKIDLPNADVEAIKQDIEDTIALDCAQACCVSAKNAIGIEALLEQIIKLIPPPNGDPSAPTKALIYDSWFDNYLGALALVRLKEGRLEVGQEVLVMGAQKRHSVLGLYYPHPLHKTQSPSLECGEIGIVALGSKNLTDIAVGDTITDANNPTASPIEGFIPAKPFVFAGLYPIESDQFENLREALYKLQLNDAALQFEPESSAALGFGFRVGFLGLLHMEVIKERLEREFKLDLIATAPTVLYEVHLQNSQVLLVQNPSQLPPEGSIVCIKEPFVRAHIITPSLYLGNLINLLSQRRGVQEKMEYLNQERVLLTYLIPSNEIVMDFYDKLKSCTKGYASFDYEAAPYQEGDLIKLDIRVGGQVVDALCSIVERSRAYEKGKALVQSIKNLIPRQLFEVALQASIGNKIIARETIKSVGKNVTAKCYGGDISRKRKLLEKQKEGKKRMKAIGKVHLPQEAFLAILKID